MKWIKNGNQLINMSHVEALDIVEESMNHEIVFYGEGCDRLLTLKFDNLETAEAHLEAIAMFLENSHQSIMAMAPTLEETL